VEKASKIRVDHMVNALQAAALFASVDLMQQDLPFEVL